MLIEKAIQYAQDVIDRKEKTTKEVIRQCERMFEDLKKQENEDFPFFFNEKRIKKIEKLLKLLIFPTGIGVKGKTVLNGLANFQCFFIVNVFGWRFKENARRFRYNDITLFIPRKNAKTFLCAICIILLMLTEERYSEMYSISVNRDLASTLKKMIKQILNNSPHVGKYFKIPESLTGVIKCKITETTYQPRTAEPNSNNSIQPSVFVADEIGAFKDRKNISAMQSGQLGIPNPLQFKLTTAYAEDKSIMLEELDYLKKVFASTIENERVFALLYYANEEHLWDDEGIEMSNPLRIEANYEKIKENRESALNKPGEQEEYLTKHVNHFLPSFSGESFIDIEYLQKCKVDKIDWKGRRVFIGLDLALTNDNVSVSMLAYDEISKKVLAKSWAFAPNGRIEEKSKKERENYRLYIDKKWCYACGDLTVDYLFIENFIMNIKHEYEVEVAQIGFDRYNCESTAQKLENEGYETVEIKQHSSVLHPTTKIMEELILNKRLAYEENKLYEVNFQNAKCTKDTNLNKFINKKKSNGKVDMVASTQNALHLLRLEYLVDEQEDSWSIEVL